MTEKQKAKELVDEFSQYSDYENGKFCALICVDEMLRLSNRLENEYQEDLSNVYGVEEYLHKLLEEIKKL